MVSINENKRTPFFFHSFDNNAIMENRFDYDFGCNNGYNFYCGNNFYATATENLTSNFCVFSAYSRLINMNARLYDPAVGRFLSPDPYVQLPDFSQSFNRYAYAMNNPMSYVDPDGEIAWFVPIIIGAVIGGSFGTVKAIQNDKPWYEGFAKGTLVGAIGGAFSLVGGGTFMANVAWGAGTGAFTGGLDAALWGENVGQGMLYGAAIGAAFATAQSTYQSIKNYNEYGMFGTNDGVFNRMANDAFTGNTSAGTYTIDPAKAQKALDFWQARNGGPNLTFAPGQSNGTIDVYGNISIGEGAFVGGHNAVRRQISHEMGHYIKNINWDNGIVGGTISDPKYINMYSMYDGDGIHGYYGAINNAGKYHTGFKAISNHNNIYIRPRTNWYISNPHYNSAWHNYGWKKWLSLIPHRF